MDRISHSTLARALVCAGALTAGSAQAGRSILVDLGNSNFRTNGQSWDGDRAVDLDGDAQVRVAVPFQLNLGGGAANYDVGFSENGFLSVVLRGGALNPLAPYGGANGGDFIAPRFADLYGTAQTGDRFASERYGTGVLDTSGSYDPITDVSTYDLARADPAIRFTWSAMCLQGFSCNAQAPSTTFQAVLIGRGGGDFDLELNYNEETAAYGFRGLALGSTFVPLSNGGFVGGAPDYCFRGGASSACDGAVIPGVPEPATVWLTALGFVCLAAAARRKNACNGLRD